MTPERWQQINQIFHAALELEPKQRHAFVAEACLGEEALQREVESLISAHEQSAEFIETPGADIAAGIAGYSDARLDPRQGLAAPRD